MTPVSDLRERCTVPFTFSKVVIVLNLFSVLSERNLLIQWGGGGEGKGGHEIMLTFGLCSFSSP